MCRLPLLNYWFKESLDDPFALLWRCFNQLSIRNKFVKLYTHTVFKSELFARKLFRDEAEDISF